uniref:DEP domain-containing protein n=1 Tax=Caenorhabditis japonica TaxID=281687 RepID=A0A8R1EUF4_CAEJA
MQQTAAIVEKEEIPKLTVFEKDELTSYWYLLLSGEVQLYSKNYVSHNSTENLITLTFFTQAGDFKHLKTLRSGALFGDLSTMTHSCSCIVSRPAQLIRIAQSHFLSIYSKHGDHLQPCIVIMHDILLEGETPVETTPILSTGDFIEKTNGVDIPIPEAQTQTQPRFSYREILRKERENAQIPLIAENHETARVARPAKTEERNFIEFHNPAGIEKQVQESGEVLLSKMMTDSNQVIRNITTQHTRVQNCMIGAEMIDWLLTLFVSTSTTSSSLSRIQMSAIWQVLLNHGVIAHIDGEHLFLDKTIRIIDG